jgi:hypothetical protein
MYKIYIYSVKLLNSDNINQNTNCQVFELFTFLMYGHNKWMGNFILAYLFTLVPFGFPDIAIISKRNSKACGFCPTLR